MKKYIQLVNLVILISSFIVTIPTYAQQKKSIRIKRADLLRVDEKEAPGLRKLIGNVVLSHKGVLMYCDSAYYFGAQNMFEAYSNVRINQGDTIELYADYLEYQGEKDLAKARDSVELIDDEINLTTDFLDYNTETSNGNYFNGGKVVTEKTVLTSNKGYYYNATNTLYFKDSVHVEAPDYTITCDTLEYNTETEIMYFLCPTHIVGEENQIYCEDGWYNTKEKISDFKKNVVLNNDTQRVEAQRVYYDQNLHEGEANDDISMIDKERNIILKGNYATFNDQTEDFFITDSAMMITISEENDSLFLHSDTIVSKYDSIEDTRTLLAYYHVKFYKSDFQGKCDSMTYSTADSIVRLYSKPVIWSGENQLTAEYMEAYQENENLNKVFMESHAFIASQEDSTKYNQLSGKNMTGYIRDNELFKIDVQGNAQTVYYPEDKGEIIGQNNVEGSNMTLFIENKKIKRIFFETNPNANLVPIKDVKKEDMFLKNFRWDDQYRPLNKYEIFIWKKQ